MSQLILVEPATHKDKETSEEQQMGRVLRTGPSPSWNRTRAQVRLRRKEEQARHVHPERHLGVRRQGHLEGHFRFCHGERAWPQAVLHPVLQVNETNASWLKAKSR